MECYICGKEGSKERLFEAVSGNGIIRICSDCAKKENYPIVRKPTTFQLKEAEKKEKNYYDKVREQREKNKVQEIQKTKIVQRQKEDVSLRDLVDRNYESKMGSDKRPRPDLVDNFHWLIMRARRNKKISREQLAREISESVAAIKMAEQGILPEDDHRLVNKIESFLNIKIRKKDFEKQKEGTFGKEPARVLKIDPEAAKNLTIDDLRRMKKLRKSLELDEDKDSFEEEVKEKEKREDKEVEFVDLDEGEMHELSEEEIDRIIFGK